MKPLPASAKDLAVFHSKDYVNCLQKADYVDEFENEEYLEEFGIGLY